MLERKEGKNPICRPQMEKTKGTVRDCQERTSKLGEGGGQRLDHAPSHATHTPTRGGCRRGEVTCVEARDTLVVTGVVADV